MIARDLINFIIPPLKETDPISKAKMWMEELRLSELPVATRGEFQGLLTEESLYDEDITGDRVGQFPLIASKSVVDQDQHYYKVLKTAYSTGVRLVAVLDSDSQYIGSCQLKMS